MTTPSPEDFIPLGASEIVSGRPFAHPHHSQTDALVLEHMCARLSHLLSMTNVCAGQTRPCQIDLHESDGRRHRIILLNRATLLNTHQLTVVGFCGQRRLNPDPALASEIEAADHELIAAMLNYPHVLSYSSLERGDGCGNWVNLVVMRNAQGINRWRDNPKHAFAAGELAPRYYASIRLHNGVLPGGGSTHGSPRLMLLRTKYYDFGSAQPWRAVRDVSSNTEASTGVSASAVQA